MNLHNLLALYVKYSGASGTVATGEDIDRELAKESPERRWIIADVAAGVSFGDVGKRAKGVSAGSIQSRVILTMQAIRARLEFDPSNGRGDGGYTLGAAQNRHPDALREEARRLLAGGMKQSEIALRLGASKASVSRWVR